MKRNNLYIALTGFCLALSLGLSAQWTKKASTKGTARSGAVSWVIGNKLYVVGGGPGQNLQEYDPQTDTWTLKAAVPWTAFRFLGVGFVLNGKGYLCTGTDGNGNYFKDLWMYDPVSNSWSSKAPFPGAGRVLGFAFSAGAKGYVGSGGDAFLFYKDMYEYDPVADSWTPKSDFPGGIRAHVLGAGLNNEGYAGAGVEFVIGSSTFVNKSDLYKYSPSTDSWSQVSDIPGPARLSGIAFASGSRLFAGLGGNSQDPNAGVNYSDIYSYDPVSDLWDTLPALPQGRSEATGTFVNGKPCVLTGRTTSATFADLWTLETPPPVTTAIGTHDLPAGLNILPRMIQDKALVLAPGDALCSAQLLDLSGRKIKEWTQTRELDCGEVPDGIYFVRLSAGNEQTVFKIVVRHL